MTCAYSWRSFETEPSWPISRLKPRIAESGVRSSWATWLTKRVLSSVARSARQALGDQPLALAPQPHQLLHAERAGGAERGDERRDERGPLVQRDEQRHRERGDGDPRHRQRQHQPRRGVAAGRVDGERHRERDQEQHQIPSPRRRLQHALLRQQHRREPREVDAGDPPARRLDRSSRASARSIRRRRGDRGRARRGPDRRRWSSAARARRSKRIVVRPSSVRGYHSSARPCASTGKARSPRRSVPPPVDGVQLERRAPTAVSARRATAARPIAGSTALPARWSSATRRTTPSSSGCTVTTPMPPARRSSGRGAVTSAQAIAGTSAGTLPAEAGHRGRVGRVGGQRERHRAPRRPPCPARDRAPRSAARRRRAARRTARRGRCRGRGGRAGSRRRAPTRRGRTATSRPAASARRGCDRRRRRRSSRRRRRPAPVPPGRRRDRRASDRAGARPASCRRSRRRRGRRRSGRDDRATSGSPSASPPGTRPSTAIGSSSHHHDRVLDRGDVEGLHRAERPLRTLPR